MSTRTGTTAASAVVALVVTAAIVSQAKPGHEARPAACPARATTTIPSGMVVVGPDDCIPRMPPIPRELRDRKLYVVVAGWTNLEAQPNARPGVNIEPGVSITVVPPPIGTTRNSIHISDPTGHWYGVVIAAEPGSTDVDGRPYRVLETVRAFDPAPSPHTTLGCAIYRLIDVLHPEKSIEPLNQASFDGWKGSLGGAPPPIHCRV